MGNALRGYFGMPLVLCYAVTASHLIYGNGLRWYALNDFGAVMSRMTPAFHGIALIQ